jgi:arabinofuranosyltransferase
MLENESLREYYEIIRLITRGPLFSSERIRAIIDINTGKYDYLIDDYASTLDEYNFQLYE